MNESNVNLQINHVYQTTSGHEYLIKCFARDADCVENMFVVFERDGLCFIKPASDIRNVDDFESESTFEEGVDVYVNQKYSHFKTGNIYVIKYIAIDSSNPSERFVVYEGQYDSPEFGHNPIWCRSYDDFNGMKVFDDDREPIKRFNLIN